MMDGARVVVAGRHVAGTGLDDDFVMLDVKAGVYYGLNRVGAEVWRIIQQPTRVADLVAQVCARFAVTPDRCALDLDALLRQLIDRGLVTVLDDHALTSPPTHAG